MTVTVVGQKDQPLRILVQTADREDAFAVVDEVGDVVALAVFGGGDDADRFVQRDQHQIFFIARFDQLTVNLHYIAGKYLSADGGAFTVDENVALFDVSIGIAA